MIDDPALTLTEKLTVIQTYLLLISTQHQPEGTPK